MDRAGMQSNSGLLELLVCPRDKEDLREDGSRLTCARGHRYSVIEGIPVLLVSDVEQTHIEGMRALAVAESEDTSSLPVFNVGPNEIDPFVRGAIGATNGGLYQHLVGNLSEYPIPRLRLPPGGNRSFLEIGCNWGRWCIAAGRLGYRPVGIDPSLKSIRAARRVAKQLGIDSAFVVADGRFLPFRDQSFDQIFSYSVLQHLSKENAFTILDEIHRTLRIQGNALVQLPNEEVVREAPEVAFPPNLLHGLVLGERYDPGDRNCVCQEVSLCCRDQRQGQSLRRHVREPAVVYVCVCEVRSANCRGVSAQVED